MFALLIDNWVGLSGYIQWIKMMMIMMNELTSTWDIIVRLQGHVTVKEDSCQLRSSTAASPSASIRHQRLVVSLVHSRLDYGNFILVGVPAYLQRRLQAVLNAAGV